MTAIAQALSAALLDFVWQGLLAAFLLWTALIVLKNRSARARYLASSVTLAVMAILPVVTACLAYTAPAGSHAPAGWFGATPETMHTTMADSAGSSLDWAAKWVSGLARWTLPVWSLGVLLFSLRLVWASRQISALRRQAIPAEATVLAMAGVLRERMKLARPVRVLVSAVADCPSVIGWIRPVVLLPAASVLGLTPQQLEAVLAHELAHILRCDYLINMLQTGVETLLFYHPAVWWASARIRQERELCCDDLAVDSCGDALCYARALTRLERLRLTTPRLAMSSAGGPLLYRIQRLTGDAGWQRGPSKLPGVLALSLGLICFALNMQWARGQQPDAPAPDPVLEENGTQDEPGVRIDLGGASLLHREEVEYPEAAIQKGIQGTVVVEATLDADGAVSDARVLSGPAELRKAALESILQWRFTHDAAGSTRQVTITFQLPEATGAPRAGIAGGVRSGVEGGIGSGVGGGIGSGVAGGISSGVGIGLHGMYQKEEEKQAAGWEAQARALAEAQLEQARVQALVQKQLAESMAEQARNLQRQQTADSGELQAEAKQLKELMERAQRDRELSFAKSYADQAQELENQLRALQGTVTAGRNGFYFPGSIFTGRKLKSIDFQGLSAAARDELLARLPVHVGDTLAEDSMEKVQAAVKQFDERLGLSMFTARDGQVKIRIAAPDSSGNSEPPQ